MARQIKKPDRLAEQFIEDRGPQFHEAFGVPCHFVEMNATYEPQDIYDLRATIERHREKNPRLVDFDLDLDHCTWEDVRRELVRAQEAARENEQRGKAIFRVFWRAMGTASSTVIPGLDAIPDNLCVLRGGLAVVFSLARHRQQNRLKILRAFEDVPNIIEMAENKAKAFLEEGEQADNIRLRKYTSDLQDTLVKAIPNLIDLLNPGTFLDKARSPFRAFSIDNLLEAVYGRAEKVRACAETIRDGIIVGTNRLSRDIRTIAHGTREDIEDLHRKVNEVLQAQRSLQSNFELASGRNSLYQFLIDHTKSQGSPVDGSETLVSEPRGSVSSDASPTITLSELFTLLDVHHLELSQDTDHVLRQGRSFDESVVGNAALMIKSRQVQHLLKAPEPGIVLVEGRGDRSQTSRVSPISYVCATLSHVIRTDPTMLFFCGRHVANDDNLCGPQGLMRSLLSQLVLILVQKGWVSDHTPMNVECLYADGEKRPSLLDVCQLFHQLLKSIPIKTPIFCIVDGISLFERQDWEEDYALAMTTFSSILADETLGGLFKLLITTPTRTQSSELSSLRPDCRVALRDDGGSHTLRDSLRAVALW